MITIRKSGDRGKADRGWLNARFTFSFADYFDPEHVGFRVLQVLNDDTIAAGRGFGPHAHRDMEILTYVLEGALLHRDSTGESHILKPNEIQTMTAGNGIVHSEFNASDVEHSRSIQIWITPSAQDLTPSYQQIAFDPAEKLGKLRLLAGPKPKPQEQATIIHQDASLYVSRLQAGTALNLTRAPQRYTWIQVVGGEILLNGHLIKDGDGAAISGEPALAIGGEGAAGGEFLFFDLP
jgi:redox-sensitive bicupin YhaK (pirin superfamily)